MAAASSPEGRGRGGADRRRALVAPALLTALALVQMALVFGHDLTPWKGGGFGMFASLDHEGWREVRVFVEGPQEAAPRRVPLTPELRRAARRARVLPREGALRALARAVLADHPDARAARVEVVRTRFDRDLAPRREPLASLRVARGAGP